MSAPTFGIPAARSPSYAASGPAMPKITIGASDRSRPWLPGGDAWPAWIIMAPPAPGPGHRTGFRDACVSTAASR